MVRTTAPSGEISLTLFLKSTFVTVKNRIRWGDLATTLLGAVLFQLWTGVIKFPLAIGAAVAEVFTSVSSAVLEGASGLGDTLVGEFDAVWDPIVAGVVGYPVAVIVLLAVMFAVVTGYQVIADG